VTAAVIAWPGSGLLPADGRAQRPDPVLDRVRDRVMGAALRADTAVLDRSIDDLERLLPGVGWAGSHLARAHTLAAFAAWQGIFLTYGARDDTDALGHKVTEHTEAAIAADSTYALAWAVRGLAVGSSQPPDRVEEAIEPWFSVARRLAPGDPRIGLAEALALAFVPERGPEALEAAADAFRAHPPDPGPDWWRPAAFAVLADARAGSFGAGGGPSGVDIEAARRTLAAALEASPSFEYAREVVGPLVAEHRSSPLDDPGGAEWVVVAEDGAGDGLTPGAPDAAELAWTLQDDRVWFRFGYHGDAAFDVVGVNVAVDGDGDPSNGAAWWGRGHSDFRFDRLVTVWVRRHGGAWAGLVGVGDARGPRTRRTTNVARESVRFHVDPASGAVAVGVPRGLLGRGPELRVVGAVGTDRLWNDDLPDSGSRSIRLPGAGSQGPRSRPRR
jgi:hypothetical protein